MNLPNAYARISLSNLKENYLKIKAAAGGRRVICVIKADAYGHGAVQCAQALSEAGADFFAVASIDEACQLREGGISQEIIILGYVPFARIREAFEMNLVLAVYSYDFAQAADRICAEAGIKGNVHIKINTGMNRLGFGYETKEKILEITKLKNLSFQGIFSHFAMSDDTESDFTGTQYLRFRSLIEALSAEGINFPVTHISNSAAIFNFGDDVSNAVRCGIALYGLSPADSMELDLKPVMTLCSTVINIMTVGDNEGIGYSRTYFTSKKEKIAVIAAGYADGYIRDYSNKAEVMIRSQKARSTGNICMDMFMADITGLEGISVGDEAELFGENIRAEDLAEKANTIPYEVVCLISKRVKRIYL